MKRKYLATLIILLGISLPAISFGAGLIPCDGVTVPCDFKAFAVLINTIINWFISISVSVAAVTFAYGGAQILFHPENEKAIEEGKEMLKKTVIGMLIILGAWLVVHSIISAIVSPSTGALRFLQ